MIFHNRVFRNLLALFLLAAIASLNATLKPVQAQEELPQNLIRQVGFDQKLNAQLPLDIPFTDSTGHRVMLGDYFGQKPVILTLGYYECPMLCSFVRNALFKSLKELDFTIGEEFEVVVVSIDPAETAETAELKRRASILDYGRSLSDEGWNFLVGEEESIQALAESIGFRYAYDPNIDQYVHPAGIVVLTPQGKIARYLYGIDFPEKDLRLGLVEAAANKIGSPIDQFLLTCYHYDPVSGEYTLAIMNIIRLVGILTVAVIGGGIFMLMRNDKSNTITPQSA